MCFTIIFYSVFVKFSSPYYTNNVYLVEVLAITTAVGTNDFLLNFQGNIFEN